MAKKEFMEDPKLEELANAVIKENMMDWLNPIKIKFLFVVPEISRTVHGRCIRPSGELKHFGKFDVLIEFSHKIWQSISDDTRKLLMLHELLHITIQKAKKDGEEDKVVLAPHDVNDFYTIISKHGVEWFREYKDIVAATYEMQGAEKDRISL